jgi:hypothetical protein
MVADGPFGSDTKRNILVPSADDSGVQILLLLSFSSPEWDFR